jgi:hypothetical protein
MSYNSVHCPESFPYCKNPFFIEQHLSYNADSSLDAICQKTPELCNKSVLVGGETIGEKPPKELEFFGVFMLFVVLLTLLINIKVGEWLKDI